MKNRTAVLVLIIVLVIAGAAVMIGEDMLVSAFKPGLGLFEVELEPGEFFTICDKKGKELDRMSRQVYVGDELITQDNMRYRVEKIEGKTATAAFVGKEKIAWEGIESDAEKAVAADSDQSLPVQNQNQTTQNNIIAVYHTHSDESYIPSDGTQSIPGEGGIFKVGDVFAEKLRSLGVEVIHDLRSHEPHDASAYRRSRRTATKLLSKEPAAIIDVHRDGVPDPDFYLDEVSGMQVSNIRLVVGRQNQNMQANYDFAKKLKAHTDERYPGLMKGIYIAKGNYNQDLSPRSVLIEAGTHTISRERAQKGIALFAESLPPVLGIAAAPRAAENETIGGTSGDAAATLFVIVALLLGVAIYLVVSTGSIEAAIKKAKEFVTVEWANFLGRRKNKE